MKRVQNLNLNDEVMVWPAERTVRDEKREPVMKNGEVQKVAARVRDMQGNLITAPIPVRVNNYYYKLIAQGNLKFCTKAEYQDLLKAQAKKAAEERVAENQAVETNATKRKRTAAASAEAAE